MIDPPDTLLAKLKHGSITVEEYVSKMERLKAHLPQPFQILHVHSPDTPDEATCNEIRKVVASALERSVREGKVVPLVSSYPLKFTLIDISGVYAVKVDGTADEPKPASSVAAVEQFLRAFSLREEE